MPWQNLHYLPLSVFVLLPTTFLATYIIAIILGHVEVEFPYISDTGTHIPESSLFAQMLNCVAGLAGLTMYVRYKQVEQYYRDHLSVDNRRILGLNKTALCCGLGSAFGLSMVANFREMELFKVHMVGASMAFGFGAIYCWLQTVLSFRMHPLVNTMSMARIRLLLSTIMTCTFTTSCICGPLSMRQFHGKDPTNWKPDDGGYHLHLVSSICEWTTAMMLDFFVLSYVEELKLIEMSTPRVMILIEDSILDGHMESASYLDSNDDTVQIIHASLQNAIQPQPNRQSSAHSLSQAHPNQQELTQSIPVFSTEASSGNFIS